MTIAKDTQMLLFRYSNYKQNPFIKEHLQVLEENGFVWMLKLGKRSSMTKLREIQDAGGWIVLRAPKADGSNSYLCKFSDVSEEGPDDDCYPEYYEKVLDEAAEAEYLNPNLCYQWFKLISISELSPDDAQHLYVAKNRKLVDEVIGTTRTAVMFIKNGSEISDN